MTTTQMWGTLLICLGCPLLGGLPLTSWITYAIAGRQLAKLGAGKISVAAAFHYGGQLAGILAFISEALRGIIAVAIARYFFPATPVWGLVALIALIIGRYSLAKESGTIDLIFGIIAYDRIVALLILIFGAIGFGIVRDRYSLKILFLVLLVVIVAIVYRDRPETIVAAIILSSLLAWIYGQIPDDLDRSRLRSRKKKAVSRLGFLLRKQNIISLEDRLDSSQVGDLAFRLSQLKRWGYSVPDGWVILGKQQIKKKLINSLHPAPSQPLFVQSYLITKETALSEEHYTFCNLTTKKKLIQAIIDSRSRFEEQKDLPIGILVQNQIRGAFSGVVFSRDPIDRLDNAVAIEALPGDATKIRSGQLTPQEYRVYLQSPTIEAEKEEEDKSFHPIIEGKGNIPQAILTEVALLAREIENLYYGVPQDIEWTHDGKQLWLLKTQPIKSLQPIWSNKIAAQIIPGTMKPLTWSINRTLVCRVWAEIFTLIFKEKEILDIDFTQTIAAHYSRAYFNVSLLGKICQRIGLPAETLEFITRGAKLNRPSLKIIIQNLPGLARLFQSEINLERDFQVDLKFHFNPTINRLNGKEPKQLSPEELLARIDGIVSVLQKAIYYSIIVPFSLAGRKAILKVKDLELDNNYNPKIKSLRSLALLADGVRNLLPQEYQSSEYCCASLFADLADMPDGQSILEQFDRWLDSYGYLSEEITDLAYPRWNEDPSKVRELFSQFLIDENQSKIVTTIESTSLKSANNWRVKETQKRLNLQGKVSQIYSQLLAHLRWSFLALENVWLDSKILAEPDDIFFLKISEIRLLVDRSAPKLSRKLPEIIRQRRIQLEEHERLNRIPNIVYGKTQSSESRELSTSLKRAKQLQGIGASPGQVKGKIQIINNLQAVENIDRTTILVVPYTDSRWSSIVARAGGIIVEVGGRLSHAAIAAREANIPAVTAVTDATQLLTNNCQVKIDGESGVIEILD